jgi:hypothetical protein
MRVPPDIVVPKWAACLALAMAGLLLSFVFFVRPPAVYGLLWRLFLGAGSSVLVLLLACRGRLPLPSPTSFAAASAAIAALIALVAVEAWPSSADEYGYAYLAETLLRGRLWNEPPPAPEIFDMLYIAQRDGKLASQYPPGWPAVLGMFRAAGMGWLANPVLTLALGVGLAGSLRLLGTSSQHSAALVAITMLSPFVLFNGASFFNHTLAAAAVMAVCYLQLRDEAVPGFGTRVAIGFAFSVLLTTRYEVFGVCAALYLVDRLWHRRARFLADAVPMALGAMPLGAALLYYNWQITGDPLLTTLKWGFPEIGLGLHATGIDGRHSPARAAIYTLRWFSGLFDFAAPIFLGFYAVALSAKLHNRTVRFYDLLPLAAVAFFVFYPDYGGFQFGPRYWFFAWPTLPLTVAALLRDRGTLRLGRYQPDPGMLAVLQACVFLGFTAGYATFTRMQTEIRAAVYREMPPSVPAVVLIASQSEVRLTRLQLEPLRLDAEDFARNGTDFTGSVLYGRDLPEFYRAACALRGGTVFLWRGRHPMVRLPCD